MQRAISVHVRCGIAAAALLTVALPLHAVSADAGCDGSKCGELSAECQSASSSPAPVVSGGMRVSIDPKTGAYTDTPSAAPTVRANAMATAALPDPTPLAGGGELLDTSGIRHEITATATASGDGLPKTNCAQTVKSAAPVE